jgi:aryl-alcohol dehydrogenase-like predicted oxidoreductase
MRRKKLGNSELEVSTLCLGTMTWGNQNSESEAHEQIEYALANGINFIDTAEVYPIPPNKERQGKTETIIGNWLQKGGRRQDIVLASKVIGPSNTIATRPTPVSLNRKNVLEAIDTSLERLQTDYVDLYQVHWPQRNTNYFGLRNFTGPLEADEVPIEETLEALGDIVKAGKARYIGISNETSWGASEYLRLAKERNLPRIVTIQNQYSLLNRIFEIGLSELCLRENVSLLAYSCLDGGALSGKYLGGNRPHGSRFALPDFQSRNLERYDASSSQTAIQAYVDLAKKHNLDPTQMALAFALSQAFVGSVIIGATTMEQLQSNITASTLMLSGDVLADIDVIYNNHPDPHA